MPATPRAVIVPIEGMFARRTSSRLANGASGVAPSGIARVGQPNFVPGRHHRSASAITAHMCSESHSCSVVVSGGSPCTPAWCSST
jgi:hypothetical protein